ncbi:hypothetical protein GQ54DRAFT_44639 [Martensiomyces pterosporus]|nr:hypothetical protein GQ54DRAFT_44639 [Martensiomyces pterosporus]
MAVIAGPPAPAESQHTDTTGRKIALQTKPPTPTSPDSAVSPTKEGFGRQRAINLGRVSIDAKPPIPWLADRHQQPTSPLVPNTQHGTTQRLRLPKRRATSTERSSSSATVVECLEMDEMGPLPTPAAIRAAKMAMMSEHHEVDILDNPRDSINSNPATLNEGFYPFAPEPKQAVRGTRSMSAARGNIAISAASRASLSHRLSQSVSQSVSHAFGTGNATSPTLPIATRPRLSSSVSSARDQRYSVDTQNGGNAELTIRLSVDASRSLSYQMLIEGDSVLSDLCVLEDENQRIVPAMQAGLARKLVALYFAATWSADCDGFTPQLLGVSSANRDDLVVIHVSADNHPADMARLMSGSGWLCVPWRDRKLRQDLMDRMAVSISDLPRLVIIDGSTHHVISGAANADIERKPLTCVKEWKESRSGLSWWDRARPW